MFNKIMLIGRLGHDPEIRIALDGTQAASTPATPTVRVANFSLATDETWVDSQGEKQERTEWHRVVVWGKQAELCAKYLTKGRLVFVEGSLQTRKYQDSQGQERSVTEVKARRVLFLDKATSPTAMFAASPEDIGELVGFEQLPTEDDLPF